MDISVRRVGGLILHGRDVECKSGEVGGIVVWGLIKFAYEGGRGCRVWAFHRTRTYIQSRLRVG